MTENITIAITKSPEEGYMYDIYLAEPEDVSTGEAESVDGGCCTGSLQDAIEMATTQATEVINRIMINNAEYEELIREVEYPERYPFLLEKVNRLFADVYVRVDKQYNPFGGFYFYYVREISTTPKKGMVLGRYVY